MHQEEGDHREDQYPQHCDTFNRGQRQEPGVTRADDWTEMAESEPPLKQSKPWDIRDPWEQRCNGGNLYLADFLGVIP